MQNFGSHYFALLVVHAHLSFLKFLAESCRSLAICRPSLCAGVVQQRLDTSALAVLVVPDPSEAQVPDAGEAPAAEGLAKPVAEEHDKEAVRSSRDPWVLRAECYSGIVLLDRFARRTQRVMS